MQTMKNLRAHLKLIRKRLKGDGWGRSEYMSLPENLT
jgi:hypothetical protein